MEKRFNMDKTISSAYHSLLSASSASFVSEELLRREAKIYIGLCALFSTLLVLGNLLYQKFVPIHIWPFFHAEISVGAIIYPLTFLITDLISELYGKKQAIFCVRLTLGIDLIVLLTIMGMDLLPATAWSPMSAALFHQIFGHYPGAFMASLIACFVSQSLDVHLFLWIKKKSQGRYLWIRQALSMMSSLVIDTSIVVGIMTALKILPAERMLDLIGDSAAFKIFFSIANIPLFYFCVWALAKPLGTLKSQG